MCDSESGSTAADEPLERVAGGFSRFAAGIRTAVGGGPMGLALSGHKTSLSGTVQIMRLVLLYT